MQDRGHREGISLPKLKALVLSIAVALTAALIFAGVIWEQLPPRMAVHFALEGTPNGWMDRIAYIATVAFLIVVIPASYLAAFVNSYVRHRGAASAPSRHRIATTAVIVVVFLDIELLAMHFMVIAANLGNVIHITAFEWYVPTLALVFTQVFAAYFLAKKNRTLKSK